MRVHPTAPFGPGRCGGELHHVPGERRRHDDQRGARPDEECSGAVPWHGPVLTDALDRRPASAGCAAARACSAEARGASPCTDESAAARPTPAAGGDSSLAITDPCGRRRRAVPPRPVGLRTAPPPPCRGGPPKTPAPNRGGR